MTDAEKLEAIRALCEESERVWRHNAMEPGFKIPPFDRYGVRQLREILDS